jgi:predicted transcriptional regulator
MRTTIRMDEELLREAKRVALETGRTLTAVIEDAVRESLARRPMAVARAPVRLPTYGGGRMMPGVDLDDGSALLDLMESGDGAG